MALLLTIFFLVFLTELVSWIGKSVLLEIVSCHLTRPSSVLTLRLYCISI